MIEVLHFVGAEQSFIANEFQNNFLMLGLKGALAGGGLALISFLLVGLWMQGLITDPSSDQVSALLAHFRLG